jgi:hypothetical protein
MKWFNGQLSPKKKKKNLLGPAKETQDSKNASKD